MECKARLWLPLAGAARAGMAEEARHAACGAARRGRVAGRNFRDGVKSSVTKHLKSNPNPNSLPCASRYVQN